MPRAADKRSNTHIRALMATTGEGLVAVDCAGNVRLMNEAAQQMLGRTRTDVIGQPIDALGVPELTERLHRIIGSRRRAAGKPFTLLIGDRHLGCRTQRFQTATDCGVAVTLRDDTPLIRQQEEWQAILASAGDGLILFSPDSRITYANPAACELLGCVAKKLVGRVVTPDALLGLEMPQEPVKCSDLRNCVRIDCPAYDSPDPRCWLTSGTPGPDGGRSSFAEKRAACALCEVYDRNSAALDGLGSDEYQEVTLNRPDPRVIKTRTSPVVDASGVYIGMVLTLHDITAEREIAQMKNEFVSTVSHELRTPLTSIKGYVDLIIDGDAGEINEIQREFLGIVKENADRLVALINDMLDISRIESGRVHLKIEPLSIADSLSGTVDSFRAVLEQSGRTVKTRVPASLPRVAADRDRVGQVLMNFVSNALKYSPDGGNVVISARRAGDFVNVSVQDHGMGISREDRKHLFTKFYRVDNALTREIGGTGLGLSICKSVIELLGGRVWVRSKLGEGSTFSFSLPIAPRDLVRTPYVQGPAAVGGKVLVVDRDPEIADLIETYLAKRGYAVIQAHTAAEALQVALAEKPLVITLDVILDDEDGFELLQHLKDHHETENIPVVVLSIVCDEGKSCRLGAADYLEKPIDQTRLLRTIDSLVGTIASPVALVVDDDRAIVRLLTDTLRKRGFAVAAAFNGREAIAAIEKRKPDVVLLDLKMPEMDGYQVIQTVKSHPDWKDIQIVVMTAHRIDRERIDILKMAAGQLSKPLSADDIAERVEDIVRRRIGPAEELPSNGGGS
jgi:signal transduction histidine kinase/DNA-binding response OmpR family regulator